MTYTYPLPKPPVVDTSALTAAIDQLKTDDTADDKTLADLKKAVEAIVIPDVSNLAAKADIPKLPDLTPYALKSDIPSAIAATGEITPVFDPLPAPQPIVAVAALTGATVVSGVVGSQMVNGGKVHSFGRTSTPPENTWNGTLNISPVVGACKVRFGITSAILGTIEVSINGATPLTASNTVSGWSGATPDIPAYVDGAYTWFEVAIAQSNTPTSVAIKIPVGRGLLPCIYAANAITSLTPSEPTALRLIDPRTGKEMVYRPSELARKADIPAAPDLTPYAKKVDIPAAPDLTSINSQIHGLDISKQTILDWVTTEIETGRAWTNGDLTYQRIFTGTTPNSSADSSVLSIAGAKEIVWWHGQATQTTGRKPAMEGLYSGNAAHGTMYTWYTLKSGSVVTGMELRMFNQTNDTRYQNIPYFVIVEYTK